MIAISKSDDYALDECVAVTAIYEYSDKPTVYMCMRDEHDYFVRPLKKDELEIVDEVIPEEWSRVKHDDNEAEYVINSFAEWANNPKFFNYLWEEDWEPAETKLAQEILSKNYKQILEEFAKRRYGSVGEAKRFQVRTAYEAAMKQYNERGFERPAELDLSDSVLDLTRLDINLISGRSREQ